MQFTIVTLYYRGSKFIPDLLQNLTELHGDAKFEWIIVDDFSNDADTDHTLKYVTQRSDGNRFPIKCIRLSENYLGAESLKAALKVAKGQYTIVLDQDDKLKADSLLTLQNAIDQFCTSEKIAGVCGRCCNTLGQKIGSGMPSKVIICSDPELRFKYSVDGELIQCTRTNILREIIEDFQLGYTNGWIWNKISKKYSYAYIDEILRIYNDLNPASVSREKIIRYPAAQHRQGLEYLQDNADLMKKRKLLLIKYLIQTYRVSFHSHDKGMIKILFSSVSINRTFLLMGFIFGLIRYAQDRVSRIRVVK